MSFIAVGVMLIVVGTLLCGLRVDSRRYIVYGSPVLYRIFGVVLIAVGVLAVYIGSGGRSLGGIPIVVAK
ncbi:MAG: hypothetical protein NC924_06525 [Candidatus Omnitrophica bacterium]|nr:hypothetical protein [Candidatus Omnitrophota bacterium]